MGLIHDEDIIGPEDPCFRTGDVDDKQMVVDDEEAFKDLLVRRFDQAEFDVTGFSSGDEALKEFHIGQHVRVTVEAVEEVN